MNSEKKAKLKSKKVVIPVTSIVIVSIIAIAVFGIGYGIATYEEPEFIKQCVESHITQVYVAPTYVSMGDGVSVPVGGGMQDRTICDKYEMVPNPKYIPKDE